MIDKKDPRQNSVRTDSSDDEAIIDLTDEVIIETEEDDDVIDLKDGLNDEAHETDNAEEDEAFTVWEATSKPDTLKEDVILELDDQFADDETGEGEDELIASAINDSLGSDEDEPSEKDDEFEVKASDDDVIILDNEQDAVEESSVEIADDDTAGTEGDDDLFDLEEEIELEYEMDEDEDELVALDDERSEDQPDFVNMVLGETDKSGRSAQTEEPTEYLEFDFHQLNDIPDMNEGGEGTPPTTAVMDAETLGNDDIEDLPDLADVTELDFEDDDEADNETTTIGEETDSGDDIITRTVEQSLGSDDESERFKAAEKIEFEPTDDADLIALDTNPQEDGQSVALEDDEPLDFENDNGLLVDLEDVTELEDDDEIIPLDGSGDFDAETEDDIVEITEFDQQYPTDSDKMLEQAGILDPADEEEDDFLELIEVEEDRQTEEEPIIGIGESDEKTEFTELDDFFSEESEEEELEPKAAETDFNYASPDELQLAKEEAEGAEDAPVPELAAQTAVPDSEDEAFDFNFDPGAIAQQVDRLDAFLSEDPIDEPEAASPPEDSTAAGKAIQENLAAEPQSEELAAFSAGQIDKAIERVINENFSDRIENIIYEVIEKTVAKEIERLKGVLLDNSPPDDNH